jgi:hypothetical protein
MLHINVSIQLTSVIVRISLTIIWGLPLAELKKEQQNRKNGNIHILSRSIINNCRQRNKTCIGVSFEITFTIQMIPRNRQSVQYFVNDVAYVDVEHIGDIGLSNGVIQSSLFHQGI